MGHIYLEPQYVFEDDEYIDPEDDIWCKINSAPNYVISNNGKIYSAKTKTILKQKKMDKAGHIGTSLLANGKRQYHYTHRLLADAFIPEEDGKPIVRHLDDNKSNNDLSNLARGTQKDNHRDSILNGTYKPFSAADREKSYAKSRKSVRAINLDTREEFIFSSENDASRALDIPQANIYKVLHGERTHAKRYSFEFM